MRINKREVNNFLEKLKKVQQLQYIQQLRNKSLFKIKLNYNIDIKDLSTLLISNSFFIQ